MSKVSRTPSTLTKTNTLAFLEKLWQNRQSLVLTINGQELVVKDAGSYQLLQQLVERLETIDGVQKSMEAFDRGEGRAAREALEELGRKHGIPG